MSPPRILVRAPNWIGDQVLAFPFFHYLRKAYPGAWIASACVPWVKDLQYRNLVDEVVELPRPKEDSIWSRLSALEAGAALLRARGPWNLGIALPNSFSAAWLLFRSEAERRRGYKADGRSFFLNERIEWDGNPSIHRSDAYLGLLPATGERRFGAKEFWGVLPENELDSPIPGELESFDPSEAWTTGQAFAPPEHPYWVLAPGATADSRRWPIDYFASLARIIADQTGWDGVIVGGSKEMELGERLCADPSLRLVNWAGRGSVASYWKLFARARLTVCNESGLAHVAALCGSPVQIVCGAADPKRTTPLGPGKVKVAINPVECWPCERNDCSQPPERRIQCLRGISAESVWEEASRGLR